MGFKYRITDQQDLYFLTATVVDWVDVFTRKELAEIVIDSLRFCQQRKGLLLYAWCLMPSHLHLIASAKEGFSLSDVMRDSKKHTSKKIVAAIHDIQESRKRWMLDRFEFAGRYNPKIEFFKFWQDGNHPVLLDSPEKLRQRLDYVHENPVSAGLVYESHHYVYSSAIDYYTPTKGLLDIVRIE